MKFPSIPFFEKKEKVEYFISLVFRDEKLNSFVFEQKASVIKIVNSQEEFFVDSLDKTSFEELLDASDKIISQAEDELDLPIEIQKTVFGLKETWVKDAKIKKEYLDVLKRLSNSLGLIPVGFLTISEAVVSLLQKEEGAPPSAILVDVGKNSLTVSLVRAGKVIEAKTAEIHQTPVFTVDTLLKHFAAIEILPSKVVLLNEDEELVQGFISHQWSKSLPFLHLPQIVSLQNDSIGKAFVIGIANQTGAEVLMEFEPSPPASDSEDRGGTAFEETDEHKEQLDQNPITEPEPIEPGEPIEPVESQIQFINSPDYFGFTNKDVADSQPPKTEKVENVESQVFEEIPEEVKLEETQKQTLPADLFVVLPKIKNFLIQLLSRIKKISLRLSQDFPIKNRGILFLAAPLLVLLLLIVYYFFYLSANVKIFVKPRIVEKNQDIVFSTTSSDFKNNTIKGDFVLATEDGTSSTNATGTKETGDKAKGTVTIFNSTDTTVTFPAASKLISSNNLTFLTLDKATIASQSGDVFSSKTPGKTNVNVESLNFGTENNLPSGTKFSIGSNSLIAAKNDNPFSGGTKKEITVISKDDIAKVQNDLIKSLEEKAKNDIKGKLAAGLDLLPNFTSESLDKKSLDKEADVEAKTVTLTGTVSYETLSYDKNEFLFFLKTIFSQDQSIDRDNVILSFENLKKSGGQVSAKMNVKVKIIPKIDIQSLSKKITGGSFVKAKNELTAIDQVKDVEIKFSPNIGFLPKNLPRISKNIKIIILEND